MKNLLLCFMMLYLKLISYLFFGEIRWNIIIFNSLWYMMSIFFVLFNMDRVLYCLLRD